MIYFDSNTPLDTAYLLINGEDIHSPFFRSQPGGYSDGVVEPFGSRGGDAWRPPYIKISGE